MNCVVITPTTGSPHLAKAMESTNTQPCEHWIVIDGEEHAQKVADILKAGDYVNKRIILLPHNTGRPKEFHSKMPRGREGEEGSYFNGHRIYSAMSYLINQPYVMFLDEDNWYDSNHVAMMLEMMSGNLNWCYTLRRLVGQEGNVIGEDDCDSLGVFANWKGVNCVDMNCYIFKTRFLIDISQSLFTGHKADKSLYRAAFAKNDPFEPLGCTGISTVNYRLSRPNQYKWFEEGNKKMHDLYNGNFPWRVK
jgi:hypothetical protein